MTLYLMSTTVSPILSTHRMVKVFGVLALSSLAAAYFFALFLVPWAPDFVLMLVVIGAVASSAGILSPILTYWISAKAGSAQGWELGKQTAAANLGVAVGSAAGGVLFNIAAIPGASFVLSALFAVVGFVLSLQIPQLLVPRNPGVGPLKRETR